MTGRLTNRLVGALGAAMALCCASGGQAATSPDPNLTITSVMTNSYQYQIGSGPLETVNATGDVRLRLSSNEGGNVSELGLDLTAKLNGDQFFFLHNGYCVGTCSVRMTTTLFFTMTNTGDTPLDIRFDSLITPGHLAQQGLGASGNFDFQVMQYSGPNDDMTQHYYSHGLSGGYYHDISSTTPFNGFFEESYSEGTGHANAYTYADWSATNLDLALLRIEANSSTKLQYVSQVWMGSSGLCTDLTDCGGVQVAFGDPRNSGSVTGRMAASAAAEPLIGRLFDVYEAEDPLFVTQGTDLRDPPKILPAVTYGAPFQSQAVPEPATWALLLMGFGAVGALLRRRDVPTQMAA